MPPHSLSLSLTYQSANPVLQLPLQISFAHVRVAILLLLHTNEQLPQWSGLVFKLISHPSVSLFMLLGR